MPTYAPRHVDIWPWTNWYSAVGAVTRENSTTRLGMGRVYTAGNQNDEIVWQVALDAGTWTLTQIGETTPGMGIATWSLDGTTIGTLDWYTVGITLNVVKQIAGFTVSTPGVYSLKAKAATKHASASSYYIIAYLVTLTRTGA